MEERSIANERDGRIFASKGTPYALEHESDEGEADHCPVGHPEFSPVVYQRHEVTCMPHYLQSILQQQTHHHMVPEEVGPLLTPHDSDIHKKTVYHQEPARQPPYCSRDIVAQELKLFIAFHQRLEIEGGVW